RDRAAMTDRTITQAAIANRSKPRGESANPWDFGGMIPGVRGLTPGLGGDGATALGAFLGSIYPSVAVGPQQLRGRDQREAGLAARRAEVRLPQQVQLAGPPQVLGVAGGAVPPHDRR